MRVEFDRQVETLVLKGYPELSGVSTAEFKSRLEPLAERLPELRPRGDGRIPFVIAIRSDVVAADKAMPLVDLRGKQGFTRLDADDLGRFAPIDGVELPPGPAYLAVELETGGGTRNVAPDDALERILAENRSPLTIAEGVALVTHHPEVLVTMNCFSILGSRCGDRRVTAMWISGGRPRLGWCWAGNPHTWLGSASCGRRVGPAA